MQTQESATLTTFAKASFAPMASWRLRLAAVFLGLSISNGACADEAAVLIEGCSVFDPESGKMIPDRTILIRGDRIAEISGNHQAVNAPAGAIRIDGHGKFAVPGLIDAHVHLMHVLDFANVSGDEVLPLYLAAGVTSVRSTGDEIVAGTALAHLAAQRPGSCPRVFTCSPLLDGDPPFHRDIGRGISDPTQVPAVIQELKRWHVTTLKIYVNASPALGRSIIDEGHRQGLPVTGHLGAYPAQLAVDDGIDCLEHIISVFNYIPSSITPAQSGQLSRVNLNNAECAALLKKLADHKTFVDPTLVVMRNMSLLPDVPEGEVSADSAAVPQRLRDFWLIYLKKNGCPQGGTLADRRRTLAAYQELTGLLFRAGVPLLAGTDAPEPNVPPGLSLHQELELLVESGLTPAAALTAATLNNARALHQTDHLGSITRNKLADIVLLNADPLKNIRNTREIELVIRSGVVSRPTELLKLVPKG
jgi:hypothetical protein